MKIEKWQLQWLDLRKRCKPGKASNRELLIKVMQQCQTNSSLAFSVAGVEEHKVQEIMTAGFTREQATQELISKNGNVQLALASLLAKSFRF